MKTRIAESWTVGLIFMMLLYIVCTGYASAQTRNDTIRQMSDSTVHLKEVQVSASRPLIKAELDKITYHVADDPDSRSMTLLEMLRKVPMVTVEGNDVVKVKGSTDFKVYVNGKLNTMMSNKVTEMMRTIPASTVRKIEVITNPGAKYDAEGIAGILNIITVGSSKLEGYNVSLGVGVMNIAQSANVSGLAKVGKLTLSVTDGVSYSRPPKGWQETERTGKTLSAAGQMRSYSNYQVKAPAHFMELSGSYEFDSRHLISMTAGVENYTRKSWTDMRTDMYDGNGRHRYSFDNEQVSRNRINSLYAGIDYQHMLGRHGGVITLSYRFSAVPSTVTSSSLYHWQKDQAPGLSLKDMCTTSDLRTDEHTGQIDYTVTIGGKHTLSVGAKYIRRSHNSDNGEATRTAGTENPFAEDLGQSLSYRQKTDISSAYAEYAIQHKLISGKIGMRYEHSSQKVSYPENNLLTRHENFGAQFDNVVPSLSIGYRIGETRMLTFSYAMRISRPNIWNLNPYVDRTNPTVIKTGNPDLTTSSSHNLSLSFNSFARRFGINMTAGLDLQYRGIIGYSYWGNPVSLTDNMVTGEDATLISTYGNLLKRSNAYLNLYIQWALSGSATLNVNANGAYTNLKSSQLRQHNNGYSSSLSVNFQKTLPWRLRMVAGCSLNSRSLDLQGYTEGSMMYRLMLIRSFLKDDRLTVAIYGNNLFQNDLRIEQFTETADFTNRFTNVRRDYRSFGINVNLRIGKLHDRVKRTSKSISNDDVITDGNPRNQK